MEQSNKQNNTICFFGAGAMAEAIVSGVLAQGIFLPEQVSVLNKSNEQRLHHLHSKYGVTVSNEEQQKQLLLQQADIIVLAMKPKDAVAALTELQAHIRADQVLVSVIAGLSITSIKQLIGVKQPVVRAMPNTSSSIGQGVTGISYSDEVTEVEKMTIQSIFSAIGIALTIDEKQQSAITAISGSGPAYIYFFVEAMTAAAEKLGFTTADASKLVLHTLKGAAAMLEQTELPAEQLRKNVTSPNGTTAAALDVMIDQQLSTTISDAIQRACTRADELGKEIERSIH
ncbi:pyrroline-5-carboxylate reductase [Paenibacillus yanchengensis]|uniref:Pyrroline-5-carboxylate reductase n=1 Tax=Paenibacillus yanchengensis TaxID=2035833 RepID=A0ABW4YJL1_9BACL